jgi:hypothetical protein
MDPSPYSNVDYHLYAHLWPVWGTFRIFQELKMKDLVILNEEALIWKKN